MELDVRRTVDGIPVVFHDRKINRLLNGKGKVINYSLSELKSFRYKDGQEILTLEEYFTLAKGKIKSILDLKSRGIESEIYKLIRKYNMEKEVIIQSSSGKILNAFYSIAPELDYAIYRLIVGNVGRILGKYLGLHRIIAPLSYRLLVKPYKIQYISLDGQFMYEEFNSIIHKKGIKIILGALRTERFLKYAKKWKVDIINADNPKEIKAQLRKNSLL